MSVVEAADVLGVHVNTVRNLVRRGQLTPLPREREGAGGDPLMFDPDDVRAVRDARRNAARRKRRERRGVGRAERAAYMAGYRGRQSSTGRTPATDRRPPAGTSTPPTAAPPRRRRPPRAGNT